MEEKLPVSLKAEDIICIGGTYNSATHHCNSGTFLPVTNSMIMTTITLVVLILFFVPVALRAKLIPSRFQALVEYIVETLLNTVEGSTGRRVGRVIFPLVATYFIFILFANWISLVPGVGTFGWFHNVSATEKEIIPLFRAPNADLNMTFALALLAIVIVQAAAIISHGVGGWLKEFVPTRGPLDIILTPIEIIGQFSRVLSLAFRLFGNVFAGEVLLLVILKIAGPALIIFLAFEVFVGFIQSLVFMFLTLTFLTLAVAGHGEDHSGEHDEHGHDEAHGDKKTETNPMPMGAGS